VGVYVGAGSRQEDLESTGTSYMLNKMLLRGTNSKTKVQIASDIENMGAYLLAFRNWERSLHFWP
jgi:predicted Zn-dependent peptidase